MVAGQGRLLGSISLFENWRFKFPVLLVGGIEEIRCDFLHLCFFARERDSGAGAGSSSNTCRDALHQWGGGEKNMRERESEARGFHHHHTNGARRCARWTCRPLTSRARRGGTRSRTLPSPHPSQSGQALALICCAIACPSSLPHYY